MKKLIVLAMFMTFITTAHAQSEYNKDLADSLGADTYGMQQYFLVILKKGTATITDKPLRDSLFRGHMNNINRLAKEGKLVVAGPFMKNDKNYNGLFILKIKTLEEVNTILQTDPTIAHKIFDVDILPWYGSAALPMYLPYHDKIAAKNP